MKTIRCLVVDDERLARRHVVRLLEGRVDVEVIGEAATRAEAIRAVEALQPDLLILDVMMPHGSGFDVLNALQDPPDVIFVTAHSEHAVRAFEVNALDYLLKPVSQERLAESLDRAVRRLHGDAERKMSPEPQLGPHDVALVEVGRSGHFVSVSRILYVTARGNYAHVITDDGETMTTRQKMKYWAERLPPELFVQLDRSLLVNVRRITAADVKARSARIVLGDQGNELRLGPAAVTRLRQIIDRRAADTSEP